RGPPNEPERRPCINRRPGRCRWYVGSKVAVGSLSAAPWTTTGKFGFSAPVVTSMAWALYCAGPDVPAAYVLEKRYAVCVAVSIAGVDVMPTHGVRSPQLRSAGFHGTPRSLRCHTCVPVSASRPYTWFVSVATSSVPCAPAPGSTTGAAYTWPSTPADHGSPNPH